MEHAQNAHNVTWMVPLNTEGFGLSMWGEILGRCSFCLVVVDFPGCKLLLWDAVA